MEGIKSNIAFLQELAKDKNQIISLQEHWLWDFEKDFFNKNFPLHNFYHRCHDTEDPITNFKAPRGQAGVAFLWPRSLDDHIQKLPEGNNRILALKLELDSREVCLINAYMPTMNTGSDTKFREHLDIITFIIEKYDHLKPILCGDLNATLKNSRNNSHDKMLKDFILEMNLVNIMPETDQDTFFHCNGKSSSQIDYILTTDVDMFNSSLIQNQDPINLSTHVPIVGYFQEQLKKGMPKAQKYSKSIAKYKIEWERGDYHKYRNCLYKLLQDNMQNATLSPAEQITIITQCLKSSEKKAIPSRVIKLRGHKLKLSNHAQKLLNKSKQKHRIWDLRGRKRGDDAHFKELKQAKSNVRKVLRKERALEKQNFYQKLENDHSTKMFHQLIRRNMECSNQIADVILHKNVEHTCQTAQRDAIADYFQELATPKAVNTYDQNFLDISKHRCENINDLTSKIPNREKFSEKDIETAIQQLNTGKSGDEYGLFAEHLKPAKSVLISVLKNLFNKILYERKIPEQFKTGIITPICKKGKSNKLLDSYRGITVSSVLGKVFEHAMLEKIKPNLLEQSSMQFGFTKGLSPTMAVLLISEAVINARSTNQILYIAALDTQKAFDVVNHPILLEKLHDRGIPPEIWHLIQDMYQDLSSKVNWKGEFSQSFPVQQGVRQGGILSTHLYKVYVDNLLKQLEKSHLGVHIGTNFAGCPTCADDILLMANTDEDLQVMLNVVHNYSREHQYTIHPTKSAIIKKNINSSNNKRDILSTFEMGSKEMVVVEELTHLGTIRSRQKESSLNIHNRISTARRTSYALMKNGVHGTNGLNPRISYKIYQIYVIPRLLYNLEVLSFTKSQLRELEHFHLNFLRNIQSLPQRTAKAAIYTLLGALPIEAEIHKRQLSLLYSIITSDNQNLKNILWRQFIVDEGDDTFFSKIHETLHTYGLPTLQDLFGKISNKEKWKHQFKTAVHQFWDKRLRTEVKDKSSLKFMHDQSLSTGKTHPVWNTTSNNTDLKKAITKARILTGTYMLQYNKSKYGIETDSVCPTCRIETEDLQHFLTRCPTLQDCRNVEFAEIKKNVIEQIGKEQWSSNFNNRESICQLIVDCRKLAGTILPNTEKFLNDIEILSRRMCSTLHLKRIQCINSLQNMKAK